MVGLGLLGLAAALAVADWLALAHSCRALDQVLKPATMGTILAAAWLGTSGPHASWTAAFFLPAFALSLLGDVFLLLGERGFLAGLVAFLLAHVAYILGLNEVSPPGASWALVLPVAGTWGMLWRGLVSGLRGQGRHTLIKPVLVYSLALAGFLFSAWAALFRPEWPVAQKTLIVCGGTLFFASDALLGWSRFVRPWPGAKLHVRVVYHLAQLSLAGSLLVP